MATPRSSGSIPVTSRPSMAMLPSVMFSSPASMRSKVDLPQPEGPTNTTNSPCSTSRSTDLMISASPKFLRTDLSVRPAMVSLRSGER